MTAERGRKQRLEIALVTPLHQSTLPPRLEKSFLRDTLRKLGTRSVRYWLMAGVGWACWLGTTVVSFLAGLYIAAPYLPMN